MCSDLTIKTSKRRHWRRSGVFMVNFEHYYTFFNVSIVDFEQVIVSCVDVFALKILNNWYCFASVFI